MQCGRCHSPATHHTPRDSTPAGRHRHQQCTDSRFTRVCSIRTKCSTKTGSKHDDTRTRTQTRHERTHTRRAAAEAPASNINSQTQTGRQTDRQTQTNTMTNRDGRAGNESVADHGGHGDEIERESAQRRGPMGARRVHASQSSHHHILTIS